MQIGTNAKVINYAPDVDAVRVDVGEGCNQVSVQVWREEDGTVKVKTQDFARNVFSVETLGDSGLCVVSAID